MQCRLYAQVFIQHKKYIFFFEFVLLFVVVDIVHVVADFDTEV